MGGGEKEAPKRYSCACGLAQESRRSKFAGKCRLCNTRPKYLLGHSLDGQLNSEHNRTSSPVNTNTSSTQFSAPTLRGQTTCSLTPCASNHHRHNSSPSCHITSPRSNPSTHQSSSASDNQCSDASRPNSPQCVGSFSASLLGSAARRRISDTDQHMSRDATRRFSSSDEFVPAITMRRCRSIDHYDFNSSDPPPYSWVADGEGGRRGGLRRASSADRVVGDRLRSESTGTLPPPYEMPSDQLPPSYEEALASSLRRSDPPMAAEAPLLQTVRAAENSIMLLPPPSVLHEQSLLLEAQREVEARRQTSILESEDELAQEDLLESQRIRREAQIAEDRERDLDLEEQRLQRNLQIAQYCGCNKCQNLYYSYYYGGDPITEASPFPMETQVIMQEVLTDGLAFCSLM